jgi:hypothetical protein
VNFVLVSAADADAAYVEATRLGRASELEYKNPKGKRVTVRFLGLRELHSVDDDLEHGSELLFEEHVASKRRFVRPRKALAVFRPRRPSPVDYTDGEIMRELAAVMMSARGSSRSPRRSR